MFTVGVRGLVGLGQFATRGRRVKASVQRALERESEGLADKIREAAPEDQGALRESVRVEPGEEELSVVIKAGGDLTTKATAGAGRPYDHALAVEFGTSKMAAEPFFFPTIRENIGDLRKAIDQSVQTELGD